MKEAIKELKLDIINGYEFRDIEFEEEEDDTKGLLYEDGKIIYYVYKEGDTDGTVIYNTKEEFFKKQDKWHH